MKCGMLHVTHSVRANHPPYNMLPGSSFRMAWRTEPPKMPFPEIDLPVTRFCHAAHPGMVESVMALDKEFQVVGTMCARPIAVALLASQIRLGGATHRTVPFLVSSAMVCTYCAWRKQARLRRRALG
jgi:hypothetical protein